MDGKASLQLSKTKQIADRNSMLRKRLNGLVADSRYIARVNTPATAFNGGMVLQSANIADKTSTRLLILSELERLVRSVNATRSFQSEDDLQDAVEDIIEVFPSLKIEEVLVCFKHIRQGKYELFGNLTTNSLIKCLHKYELDNTVPMRERQHTEQAKELPYHTAHIDWARLAEAVHIDPPRRSLEEMGGHTHLTANDLQQIEKAQKESKQENPST